MNETESETVLKTHGGKPESTLVPLDGSERKFILRIPVPKRWLQQELAVYEEGKEQPIHVERDPEKTLKGRTDEYQDRDVFKIPADLLDDEDTEYRLEVRRSRDRPTIMSETDSKSVGQTIEEYEYEIYLGLGVLGILLEIAGSHGTVMTAASLVVLYTKAKSATD